MKKYILGLYYAIGGIVYHDGRCATQYVYIPASYFWKELIPKIECGRCGSKGVYLRYNDRFFEFFWKPYSPHWIDKEGVLRKSKRFQFLSFKINQDKKGKHMNDITQDQISTQMAEVHQEHPAVEVQAGRDETPVKVKEVFVQDDEHIGGTPVVM